MATQTSSRHDSVRNHQTPVLFMIEIDVPCLHGRLRDNPIHSFIWGVETNTVATTGRWISPATLGESDEIGVAPLFPSGWKSSAVVDAVDGVDDDDVEVVVDGMGSVGTTRNWPKCDSNRSEREMKQAHETTEAGEREQKTPQAKHQTQ